MNSVYDIPDNDQLIREIVEMFKKDIDAGNVEEMDDSTEITTISASSALKNYTYFCYSKMTRLSR